MVATYETVLRNTGGVTKYLNEYLTYFSAVYRCVWQYYTDAGYSSRFAKQSYFVTFICQKFGLLKRTVNSILNDVIC